MPKTYSVKETATILGFSTNTIYSFLNSNKLQGVRIGKGRFRIPQSEIDRIAGATMDMLPYQSAPGVIEEYRHQLPKETEKDPLTWMKKLSLVEWFLGMGSILFGLSMFIYTAALEHVAAQELINWYWVLRVVFILFGIGFILSKLLDRIPPIWGIIYHGLLIASFAWLVVISHFAHDPQGTVIGFVVSFIFIIQLFFTPAYYSLISLTVLFIAVMNTVLFITAPQFLSAVLVSFGLNPTSSIFGDLMIVIVPYIAYALLVITHKLTPRLYYVVVIIGALMCIYAGYATGVNLYWRQGLAFLFTGCMLFLYATWQTEVMKRTKQPWITSAVMGYIFFLFLGVLFSLKIFELVMYNYANRDLQVKVENGKTYLETIFGYAKNSFGVSAVQNGIVKDLQSKDRAVLTLYVKAMYEQFPHLGRVVLLGINGTELASYPEDPSIAGKNFAFRAYFQDALTTGETVFSDVVQTTDSIKQYTIVIATPIVKDEIVYGVVAGSFDMDEISRTLQSFAADEQGEYFGVLDQKGVRLVNPNKDVVGVAVPKNELAKFSTIPYWKTHLDTRVNPQGDLVLSTYRTVDFANLNIAAIEPYKENLQANLVAVAVTSILGGYGYLSILLTWFLCYKKYKTVQKR